MKREVTKDQLYDAFDAKEGRVRLYHSEMESVIGALASMRMLEDVLPGLKRVGKLDPVVWERIRGGFSLLKSGLVKYTTKIGVRQYRTLTNNIGNIQFVPSVHHPKYCMDEGDYYFLVQAARIGHCQDCLRCMNKCDWQKCELRQVLDCVPCKESVHEKQRLDEGSCPYTLIDKTDF